MKIRPAAIFSFCALVFFIIFVYEAKDWRLQARLYPWAIGLPMIILAAIQVILDLRGIERKADSDNAPVDFQMSQSVDPQVAYRRTVEIFAWIVGFFLSIWLLGFSISIPLFVFSYLKIRSHESWAVSITLTAAAWLAFYGLFVRLLNLPFPDGLVFAWLGI